MPTYDSTVTTGQSVPGGGFTLDALMQRQRELALQQGAIQRDEQPTIQGGLGQMLSAFITGRQQRRFEDQYTQGRQALGEIYGRMTPEGNFGSPQDMALAEMLDPQGVATAVQSLREMARQKQQQQFELEKPSTPEQWVIYGGQHGAYGDLSNPENRKAYEADLQQAVSEGMKQAAAAATAGTAGAEFDAKSISDEIDKGTMTGPGFMWAWAGRGSGGKAYRAMQAGLDSLRQQMTQAGKSPAEVEDTINRLTPSLTDDATALHDKVNGIQAELENLAKGLPNQPSKHEPKSDEGPPGNIGRAGPNDHEGDTGTDPAHPGKKYVVKNGWIVPLE